MTEATNPTGHPYTREIDAERVGWYRLADLVRSLTSDECLLPGYYRDPDWAVRDLVAHVGTWLAEAEIQLERIRVGTYEGHDIDIDALNAAMLEAMRDQPWSIVWVQANAARTRMLQEWSGLEARSDEAAWWIRKSGSEHYADHLDRLREWVDELLARRDGAPPRRSKRSEFAGVAGYRRRWISTGGGEMPGKKSTRAVARGGAATSTNGRRRSPEPRLAPLGIEIQRFGSLRLAPIALPSTARSQSCRLLNVILADSMILYSLYKKHHWLVTGPTFYQLHLLFDKHAEEQGELIDQLAERVQSLGGIAVGDPRHAAELTTIDRPPNGAEAVPAMIHRLLDAHEAVIEKVRDAIERTEKSGDWGSNDLLMGDVLRTHELQVWFVSSHVVDIPLVEH